MSPLITVMTPALLSALRNHPTLPHGSWYIIAASALTILNRPDEIAKVYTFALEHGSHGAVSEPSPEDRLSISRRIREALIKASAVGGVPKVTPEDLLDEPGSPSPTGRPRDVYEVPSSEVLQRGQSFFEKVYGKIAKRVMGQMDRSGTEDLGLAARLMYGHILSNTQILSPAETSFILIAGLIPQDVNPQLKGHLRGALNGGATVEEVRAVREATLSICEATGMRRLADDAAGGWGWRSEVANV